METRMSWGIGLVATLMAASSIHAATQTVNTLNVTGQWPTPNPAAPPANGTAISTGINLSLPLFNPTLGYLTKVDLSFSFSTSYGASIFNGTTSTYIGSVNSNNGTNVRYNMAPFGQLWNFNAPAEGATIEDAVGSFRASPLRSSPTRSHGSPLVTFTAPDHVKHFVGIGNTTNLNAQQFYTVSLQTTPTQSGVNVSTFQRAFSPRATAVYTYNPFGAPMESGGGLTFSIAEGPRIGQGQVEPTPTGVNLRHGVEAMAGMPAITENTASRQTFRFQRIDGQPEQAPVFINGLLDGFLEADHTGRAEALAVIELYTAAGALLQRAEHLAFADSIAHNNGHVAMNVHDRFGITTTLTPGEVYELRTELIVTADPRGVGYALADFNHTFEVELSGSPAIPEPITLGVLAAAFALTRPGAGRRPR